MADKGNALWSWAESWTGNHKCLHKIGMIDIKDILKTSLLYIIIIALIIALQLFRPKGKVFEIYGYSYFNVLTASMQSVYPVGSIIITRQTAVEDIAVGNDITFFSDDSNHPIITHRVIKIYENYKNSGETAFQTMGIDNASADDKAAWGNNVIGIVKFHIPYLGIALAFIGENLMLIAAAVILIDIIIKMLRIMFARAS